MGRDEQAQKAGDGLMAAYLTPTYLAPRTKTPGQIAAERERLTGARELTAQTQAMLAAEGRVRLQQVKAQRAERTVKAAEATKSLLTPDAAAYAEHKGFVKQMSNPDIDPVVRAREAKAFEKDFQREKVFHPAMKALGWSKVYEAPGGEAGAAAVVAGAPPVDVWVQKDATGQVVDYSYGQPAFATKAYKQGLYAESIAKARAEQAAKTKTDSTIPIFKLVSSEPGVTNVMLIDPTALEAISGPVNMEVGMSQYETLGYIGDDALNETPAVPPAKQFVVTAKPAGCGWLKHLLPAIGVGVALWLILRKKKKGR
jgi:hypothetical protein